MITTIQSYTELKYLNNQVWEMGSGRSQEGVTVYHHHQSLLKYLTVIDTSCENILLVKSSKGLLLPDKKSFLVDVCRLNCSFNKKNKFDIFATRKR